MRPPLIALSLLAALALSTSAAAQDIPSTNEQMTAAVLPLPASLRAGAGVMGYKTLGKLEVLKPATNGMICLADDPAIEQFHVACYAETLEPFMARGRALRASGVTGQRVDSARFDEVKKGTLRMPVAPAALYSLTGPKGDYDAATGRTKTARSLFVLYMPMATSESTGLPSQPHNGPWIMSAGTPKAHLMLTIGM
jgi:hypothetical protein